MLVVSGSLVTSHDKSFSHAYKGGAVLGLDLPCPYCQPSVRRRPYMAGYTVTAMANKLGIPVVEEMRGLLNV